MKQRVIAIAFLGLGLVSLNACKDEDPELTRIDDILEVSVAEDYTDVVTELTSLDDLPEGLEAAANSAEDVMTAAIIEKYSSVALSEVVEVLEAQLEMSDDEVSELLKNNVGTYQTVVERMATLPDFTSGAELEGIAAKMANSDAWSDFLMQPGESSSYLYAGRRYEGAVRMSRLIDQNTIACLEQIDALSSGLEKAAYIDRSTANLTSEQKQRIASLICIAMHHFYEIVSTFRKSLPDHDGGASN